MKKYYLNTESGGLITKIPSAEAFPKITLLTLEEFNGPECDLPFKAILEESMTPVQYCKIEIFGSCLLGTMQIPKGIKGKIRMYSFGFYKTEEQLWLIEAPFPREEVLGKEAALSKAKADMKTASTLETLLERLEQTPLGPCTLNKFLLLLLELQMENDVLYLQQQEEQLAHIEERLLKRLPQHFYEAVILYRKRLSVFHTYYEQLMNMDDFIQTDINQEFTQEEKAAWQRYSGRAERYHNHVEMLKEYLVQIRDLYQSLLDERQNKTMGLLTVVTTIFFPLTLFTGWYGMNFTNMPELTWEYGYPVLIILSALLIVGEIIYFKKKKIL